MKYNKFTDNTSTIVIVIMLTTTIAIGSLNILQINYANAQNQAGSNNSQSSQGSNGMQINNSPNLHSMISSGSDLAGSISIYSPIINGFKSLIHISLTDAIKTAQNSIGNNSTTVAAFIHPDKGLIIYNIFALDSNNNAYKVIVDPGNGKILSSQQMSIIEMMMALHGGGAGMGMGSSMDNGMPLNHGMGMDKALH